MQTTTDTTTNAAMIERYHQLRFRGRSPLTATIHLRPLTCNRNFRRGGTGIMPGAGLTPMPRKAK